MLAAMVVILAYLLGSVPTAYIAGRWVRGVDIRILGDRNVGAANTYREIGARAGLCVFLADVAKGAVAILVANSLDLSQSVVLLVGIATVAGHNWPLFLGFHGGRGVATAIGVLLALMPLEMSIPLALAVVCLVTTRDVILTSAVLFVPIPLIGWLFGASGMIIGYGVALPCVVGLTHYVTTRRKVPVHG